MYKETSKRIISLLLCTAMLLSNFSVVGFAAEQDGLCEHHTDHADCGYVEGSSTCDYVCEVCAPAADETTESEEPTEPVTEPEETTEPATEPITEETEPVCTGLADCAAESHGDSCEKKIEEDKAAADKAAADVVAALIAQLPTLKQLKAMPLEEQILYYNQVQSVYSAYEQLTDDQKALLPPAEELFKPYFDYFNGQTEELMLEGTCGENLTWTFDEATGKLTISGTGPMTDYTLDYTYSTPYSTAPWSDYISLITSVELTSGVTSIGHYAFYYCLKMTSITIPDSVTSIGHYAFAHCYELKSITIPDSVTSLGDYMCYGCTRMDSATIGNSVTSISAFAFYQCNSLKDMTIGNSVTSIGEDAFHCSRLEDVYITDIYAWRDVTFMTDWSNPMDIGDNLHILDTQGNEVTEFVWDSSRTTIPAGMFEQCSGLTSITIPASVTSIGQRAFYNCSSLTSITIPDSVTSIPNYTFYGCAALASITIPDRVTSIGSGAFEGCSSLTSIMIPDGVTSIGYAMFRECNSLTIITIPDSVTSINDYAFEACSSLTSIMISGSVTYIAEHTFYRSAVRDIYYCGSEGNLRNYSNERVHYNCSRNQEWMETHWEVLEVDVTCTEDGYTYEQCSCGHTRNKTITTPRSHKLVIDPAAESTCLEPGKTEGTHCDRCQNIYVPQEEIAPFGHYVLEAGKVPTSSIAMQNDAQNPFVYERGNGYASTNHKNSSSSVFTITALYDCQLGLGCEVSSEQNYDKLTISLNNTIKDTISGQTSKLIWLSLKTGDKVYIRYSKNGDWSSGEDRGYFWIYSCTETLIDGQKRIPVTELKPICTDEIICAGCNQTIKSATEHPYKSVVTPPTCTTGGYTTHTCPDCGDKYQDADVPALGHHEVIIPEIAGTCTEFGLTEGSHCSNCGKIYIEQSITPYSHSYSNGRCTDCGQYSSLEGRCGDSVYWRLENNGTSLYIYGTGTMYDYRGDAPWTAYKSILTKVVVEDGVENIGDFAFYECSALNSVVMGKSVKTIGEGAFQECLSLTGIALPPYLKTIEMMAFFSSGLRSLSIEPNVSYIGSYAFAGCDNLLTTNIYNISLYIGTGAFMISGTQYQKPIVKFRGGYPPTVEGDIFSASGMMVYYPSSALWDEDDCDRIGNVWVQWIATNDSEPLGCSVHQFAVGSAKVPSTCTRQGYSEMTYCSVCGAEISSREALPLAPHSEEIVYIEEPTCTKSGLYNIVCTVCNVVIQKNLVEAPYGHDFSGMHHKCVRCDYYGGTCGENLTWVLDPSNGSLIISGTGAMNDYSADNAPWDTHRDTIRLIRIATGVTAIAPDTFGDVTHERDIYYGGTAEEWNDLAVNVSPNDRVHYSCTEPEGHWQFVTVEMTCEEDGYTAYRCDCGHEYGRTIVQPASGHTIVTDAAVSPTCMQTGLMEGTHCAVCEEVIVAQEVIPATGHAYKKQNDQLVCNTCGQEVYVRIRQDYLAMDLISFREAYLDLQVSHEELRNEINWTVEGDSVALDAENLCLAAEKLGNAWITATVTVSNGLDKTDAHYEEFEVSSRCRVEVAESIQLKGIQLSTATVTTELFKRDYTGFEILLQLPDYYPEETASTYSLRKTSMMDRAWLIRVDKNGNEVEDLTEFFELEIMDDRTVRIVPTKYAVDHPTEVATKYSNLRVVAEVQGTEYESETLTLTVKKTMPKLKATVAAFNSFYSGQSQPIVVTGATVTKICENESKNTVKTTAIPAWLKLNDGILTLAEDAPLKSASGKAYIQVWTEEWSIPADLTLSVKNTYKAPRLKLPASAVTMSADAVNSRGIELKLLCSNKKETLSMLNVSDITVPEDCGYIIDGFNVEDGTFTLKPLEGFKAGKLTLTVSFKEDVTTMTIPLTLTVKTAATKLKLSKSSISLNKAVSDRAVITVTATPADYILDLKEEDLRLTDSRGKALADPDILTITPRGDRVEIAADQDSVAGTYRLYVKSGNSPEAYMTIKVISNNPTVSFRATGALDHSFPEQFVTVTPTFKNYNGGFEIAEMTAKNAKKEPVGFFHAEMIDNKIEVTCIDEKAPVGSYTLTLKLVLEDGTNVENIVKVTVKRTAAKLKLSASRITLNKNLDHSAVIDVTAATKNYQMVEDQVLVTAPKQVIAEYKSGKLTVKLNTVDDPETKEIEAAAYGKTYKVTVSAYQGAPAVALSVVVPAEKKSDVGISIKAVGTIDVIREGTAITVTPTITNAFVSDIASMSLNFYKKDGKLWTKVDKDIPFEWDIEDGKFIITAGEGLNHTDKYRVELVAAVKGAEPVVSKQIDLKVKMGSVRLTAKTSGTTMFAKDKYDRALVWFETADTTLNDVVKVEIRDAKYKEMFEIIPYGNGQFAIGYKDNAVHSSLIGKKATTAVTLNLNVFLEGNGTEKANTTAKVTLTIVK